jgi:asparagine synthetase B (glutamine-hydrolysing)
MLLDTLIDAMKKRVSVLRSNFPLNSSGYHHGIEQGRIAILFSGGIDSVILAAILHGCLDSEEPIDLLNVSFDQEDEEPEKAVIKKGKKKKPKKPSPDRAAAIVAMGELEGLYPARRWRLVHIDVTPTERDQHEAHIKQLIKPRDTHMDLNIGSAFWFAARGHGYIKTYTEIQRLDAANANDNGRPLLRIGAAGAAAGVGMTIWTQKQTQKQTGQCNSTGDEVGSHQIQAPRCSRAGCRRVGKRNCLNDLCRQCCLKIHSEQAGEQMRFTSCPAHKSNSKHSFQDVKQKEEGLDDGQEEEEKIEEREGEEIEIPYCSRSRILLVGLGADEQMAGYGRHRTTYLRDGTTGLEEELNRDLTRLWERNLGRDDRCISDTGKEAWFPFLDEGVVKLLQNLAIEDIVQLNEAPGVGDKRILRDAGKLLGLSACSEFVKRAIQFGSRIAKITSQNQFGSTRKGKGTIKIEE